MAERKEGTFRLKCKTAFADIAAGKADLLGESDLTFQDETHIYQYSYERPEKTKRVSIGPGTYNAKQVAGTAALIETELRDRPLLESVTNTSSILGEARAFFSKLEVYEKYGRPKKRGVLLYSKPGLGKTSAIARFCTKLRQDDAGTVIINWPTSEVDAEDMSTLLADVTEYSEACTKLVLIIEDIGGGERSGEGGPAGVTSGLLNLLDGVNVTFRLPTFIVATTNHPENLLASLANRPGRFDLVLELKYPCADERVKLFEFIAKRPATEAEVEALKRKAANELSIAHLEEIVIRAELHDKTTVQVLDELINHNKKFKKGFEEDNGPMGLG